MSESSKRALRWVFAAPLLCAAGLAAVGIRPTSSVSGRDGLIAMGAAALIVLAVVYATMSGAVRKIREASANERLAAALRTGVIRFFATLVAAGLVLWQSIVSMRPFLIWVAICYVVIINVETILLVRWMGTLDKE